MVVAQADGLQLLPDTSEAVAGVVSVLILVAIILVVIGAIAWFKRAAERRRELVVRVARLEELLEARGGQDTNP